MAHVPTQARTSVHLPTELALLVVLSFLWGGSFTLIKIAVETIPPVTIVAVRVGVAAVVLLAVVGARGLAMPRDKRVWVGFAVQGVLQSALPFVLISWGEVYIDSALAGILNATPPIFVLVVTLLVTKQEAIGGEKIFGVLLGIAGVAIVIGVSALQGLGLQPLAQLAVTGASVSYAIAAIWTRRFAGMPAAVTAAGAMACAAVIMVPLSLLLDRPWALAPSGQGLLALACLSFLSTAFGMLFYFRLVQTLGAVGTTSGSYLRAGFSVVLGVIVLDESFAWPAMLGMALIVAGVAGANGQLHALLPGCARAANSK
jgi:drug/metabolite transporter (DMT)-like permease